MLHFFHFVKKVRNSFGQFISFVYFKQEKFYSKIWLTRLFIECEWTMVSNNNVWALWFGDLSTSEPQSQSQFKPQLQCSQRFSCLESWFYSCRLISDFICGATASFQSRVNRLFWTRFWLVWPGKFFIRDCICKLAKKYVIRHTLVWAEKTEFICFVSIFDKYANIVNFWFFFFFIWTIVSQQQKCEPAQHMVHTNWKLCYDKNEGRMMQSLSYTHTSCNPTRITPI